MTINLNDYIGTSAAIPLAKQGEFGREVTFDFSAWVEMFGSGSIGWSIQRPQDSSAYLLPSTEDGTVSVITLTETESQKYGYGLLEVFYVNTGETEKRISKTFSFRIDKSLQNLGAVPSPWQSYVDAVHEDAVKAEEASQSILDLTATATVDSSVGTPSVSVEVSTEDDHKNMAFAFSNMKGEQGEQGETGNGISNVSVEKTATVGNVDTYTMTISYTDGDSDTATFDITNSEVTEEEFLKAFPVDTASGSIASYPDGADLPVKDLKVSVEPVQDLHGYANPWVGGGGVNILDTTPTVNSTYSNSIPTILSNYKNDGVYATGYYSSSFNQNASYCTSFTPCEEGVTYQIKHFADKFSKVVFLDNDGNIVTESSTWPTSYSHTATATEKYIMLGWKIADINAVMISKGNTAPTAWSPYSNICPITGWNGANVVRTGKNLFGKTVFSANHNMDGTGVMNANTNYSIYVIPYLPSGTYIASYDETYITSNTAFRVVAFDGQYSSGNGTELVSTQASTAKRTATFTVTDKHYLLIQFRNSTENQQIEVGSTATAYEAYSGNTYPFTFGQTVYGGTLDVTSGVLTVDRKYKTPQKADWRRNSGTQFYVVADTDIATGEDVPCISDKFRAWNGTENKYNTPYICFVNSGGAVRINTANEYATVDDYWNAIGESSFVCQLASPQSVQLTATEVKSLLGQNNIFADCGSSEVEYRADVTLYIQKLTGSTEEDMIANANIANNKYFLVGSRLFFSTSAIAQGASIIVGTNCTETNLADALNALNT